MNPLSQPIGATKRRNKSPDTISGDESIYVLPSPLGQIGVVGSAHHITRLVWLAVEQGEASPLVKEAGQQLIAYFDKRLKTFDLPLAPRGSDFQQRVYRAMLAIPYGQTRTYGELANDLNTSAQPVGQGCGANPLPIIIPCHRVLAANGSGGFSAKGGVESKIALLELEGGSPFLL